MSASPLVFMLAINPEPWTAPSVAVGRRNGKPFPQVYKSEALRSYQEAVKELVTPTMNRHEMFEGRIDLRFFFWRQLPDYVTDDEVRARKHYADATNMQKALEDALQGVVFKNDRDVAHVESWIMEQGKDVEPRVVIQVRQAGLPPLIDIEDWLDSPLAVDDGEPFFARSTGLF